MRIEASKFTGRSAIPLLPLPCNLLNLIPLLKIFFFKKKKNAGLKTGGLELLRTTLWLLGEDNSFGLY